MDKNMWGEGNTRNFLNWADKCRDSVMKDKGLSVSGGINFIQNANGIEAKKAIEDLLRILKPQKKMSVLNLYKIMPNNLLQNPTTKNLLVNLYYSDQIIFSSKSDFTTESETDFSITFIGDRIEKNRSKEILPQMKNVVRKQSNIEDIMDNKWTYGGRKLDFEKQTVKNKNVTSDLNISLNTPKAAATNAAPKEESVDIRKTLSAEKLNKNVVQTNVRSNNVNKIEIPIEVKNDDHIKYIKIEPNKVEIKEVKDEVKLNTFTVEKLKDPVIQKPIVDETVFYFLSSFELFYLEFYFNSCKKFNKSESVDFWNEWATLLRMQGELKYSTEDNKIKKGKIRKNAKKKYKKDFKIFKFDKLKVNLSIKYSKIVKI